MIKRLIIYYLRKDRGNKMGKKVFYNEEAREKVLKGAEVLYNAVKTTMGSKGRNVVTHDQGKVTVTHDGVTVAKSIILEDTEETMGWSTGAELIKQAANQLNTLAGDGTTTVTVLTYHILNAANKLIAAGHNPMVLRKELEKASKQILEHLEWIAQDITADSEKVAQIATISAGDSEIGNLIADVIKKIGKEGVVTVEEGRGLELESEVVEGFTLDMGFISSYMVTNAARQEAVYSDVAVVVTDRKISNIKEFLPVLEHLAASDKKRLLIIAEDVEGEALATLVLNKLKDVFSAVAVKAPRFGDQKKEILQDIAILTGATVISEEKGMNFDNVTTEVIGHARRIIVTKDSTTVIAGESNAEQRQLRIEDLHKQISNAKNDYEKQILEQRKAALEGKVAVIKVGGTTETEIEEKKFRVDDAVAAAKAAVAEGVVPGGGITLLKAFGLNVKRETLDPGARILLDALEQPFRILLENAGLKPDSWIKEVISTELPMGLDVNNPEELIDLEVRGIVDPVKVTRLAVENSVSIAGTAMTMGALVVEEVKKPKED